jgi:hypothetical protein
VLQLRLRGRLASKKAKADVLRLRKEQLAACVLQRAVRVKLARAVVKHLKRGKYGDAAVDDADAAAAAALLVSAADAFGGLTALPFSPSADDGTAQGGAAARTKSPGAKVKRLKAKRAGAARADADDLMADIDSWAAAQADATHNQKPTRHEAKLEVSKPKSGARRLSSHLRADFYFNKKTQTINMFLVVALL